MVSLDCRFKADPSPVTARGGGSRTPGLFSLPGAPTRREERPPLSLPQGSPPLLASTSRSLGLGARAGPRAGVKTPSGATGVSFVPPPTLRRPSTWSCFPGVGAVPSLLLIFLFHSPAVVDPGSPAAEEWRGKAPSVSDPGPGLPLDQLRREARGAATWSQPGVPRPEVVSPK